MINRDIFTGELQVDKLERFTFGKHKGQLISAVKITDPDYFIWLVDSESLGYVSETWQEWIKDYAAINKNKIYAGSYSYLKKY